MSIYKTGLRVRQATQEDAPSLCEILNEIILMGGTTALETPMSAPDLAEHYIDGSNCLSCCVLESDAVGPLGFQMLIKSTELPIDWADIGTFTRGKSRSTGIGTTLFECTKRGARDLGIVAINATIRADNRSGLSYYEKMGFSTYKVVEAVPLKDGTPVDRIYKKYFLQE